MLSLTRKTEYALIAVCHLARRSDAVVSAREIGEQHHVPLPLLMNVLKTLGQRGVIRSVRGVHGGYALAVPPAELTLARLIESVEGPVRLVRCSPPQDGDSECELAKCCSIRSPVQRIHARLVQFLEQVTVADLAFDEQYLVLQTPREPAKVMSR